MTQKYVSQPNMNGKYEVARFNVASKQYEVIGTEYTTEEEAKERALELNMDYKDDYEYEHQDELISKYHNYALSKDTQKQNAAKEFFTRFPYQRDVCEEILAEMKANNTKHKD